MKKPTTMLAVLACASGLATAAPALGTTTHRSAATTSRPSADGPAVPSLDGVAWSACHNYQYPDLLSNPAARCGDLKVPLDYARPHGKKITLAVSLLRHTSSAKDYQGVMLSNPGGPGGSGLGLGADLAYAVPHGVGHDYDWVSFDPRGVGASRPAIRCQPHYFKAPRRAYVPGTGKHARQIISYWKSRSKDYAAACERKYPQLLKNMTTRDSVKDMESIRQSLGVKKISYYGFSYGTYLGQVYSTLHPNHLKRMVLDSNVDPRHVWYRANLDQDRAFNRAISIFFTWVANYHHVYQLGSTERAVERHYYQTLRTLTRDPLNNLGPAEWSDGVENAAYDRGNWEDVASAWREYAIKGHSNPMVQEYRSSDDPGDDNEYAVYNAVQCTDVQWPQHWSKWRRDNDHYNTKYPFLTWGNAWYNAPCFYWGAKASTPVKVNGKHVTSALLIDEKLDAATPYEGSLEVRKLYPHSSLIAEPHGTTHADSLEGDACVDNKIARYLATGHRPKRRSGRGADATCAPLSTPSPNATSMFAVH